jgi:serine/threonine-protein kinase
MKAPLEVGCVLDGRFCITSLIGRGAVTSVYEAVDGSTGRCVVVKVPRPGIDLDPLFLARMAREESIGSALNHPSVVRAISLGKKSRPYLVLEKSEGVPLSSLLQEGRPLPVAEAVRIAAQILRALEYLHANRVIHRDLKPANVMVLPDGSIRVLDLGAAKGGEGPDLEGVAFGQSLGTPDYMPPEQVEGQGGDARSDLYSLGAVLYEMLTGFPPFQGDDVFTVMHARVSGDPVGPRQLNLGLTPQIEEILLHALERRPEDRYASAGDFLRDLEDPQAVALTGRAARLKPPDPWFLRWRRIREFVWAMAAMMGFFAAMVFVAWAWGGRRWR